MGKSPKEFQAEIDDLRLRLHEAEETLRAIGSGEVDAFVVSGPDGEKQIFTLKGAEQPYRILVETMSEGAATLATDGTILYGNTRLASLLHVPLENIIGTQLGSYVAPADRPLFFALLDDCTEKHVKNEMTMLTRVGTEVPVLFSCSAHDLSGNSGVCVVITDLTQQKRNEEIAASEAALRASEERLALATSATHVGMFDWDIASNRVLWTQTHEAIFGYAPATTTTTTTTTTTREFDISKWADRVHPEDLAFVMEESNRCMRERIPLKVQHRIIWPDGSLHWIETKGIYQYQRDGTARRLIGVVRDITESKQAEETLALAYLQIQSIIDNTPAIVYAFDLEERFLLINAAVAKLFNSTPAQIIGKRRCDFMPQADADWHEANDRKVIEAGRALEFEEHSELPGRSITWLTTKFPLLDAGGQIYAVGGISTDISERKQAEIKLQASEKRIQQALHVSRSFTFDWLPVTDQVLRSDSCAAILRLDSDEAVNDTGEHFFQCIHPDDRERFVQILRGLTPTADSYITEYRYVCKDGSEITLEETGQASFDSTGTMLRLVGVATDISTRKQAEEALRKVYAELETRIEERTSDLEKTVKILEDEILERQKAEQNLFRLNRFYAVLSGTNHAIVKVRDRESLFRDFCRIAVEHGGFLLCWIGLVDEHSGKVNIAAASGATAYLKDIRITVNNEPEGEGPTGIVIREGTYYISNDFQNDSCTRPWHELGKAHGIFASASIAIRENGRVIGALTLYSRERDYFDRQQVELLLQMGLDISFALDNLNRENSRLKAETALYEETIERLKTVEALREKEQMLIQQSRLAAMGDMINNIAHQWRQPLNVLGLISQQMQLFYDMGTFNKEYLDESVNKSMNIISHMSRTIDDFRDFFKPDKGKVEFAVKDVVEKAMALVEDSFSNQQITIEFNVRDTSTIYGYPNEYSQVLLNILLNAKDAFMENRSGSQKIMITMSKEGDRAVVTIADNAGGIPKENLFKIFDPYFTTKGPDKGTGVGLFMSKTIIEKNMGGRLTARNIDDGAEFRIEV